MKVRRSTYIHKPDLHVFDKHIVGRRAIVPLVKPVTFRLHAPEAKKVWLAGNFGAAGFRKHAMKKLLDGYWECSIELKRGHYEYHFLVDGVRTPDPKARVRLPDSHGGFNNVVEVG
jgi:1,4-alpha-glucan branching enzyme